MAQTRKRRRSKHRGTAAGTVTSRGRTGRPPSPEERKKATRAQNREKRLNAEPTWRSSLNRAGFAGVIMFLFLVLTTHGSNRILAAIVFALAAIVFYVPAGYYLERYLWRRRQRKQTTGGGR